MNKVVNLSQPQSPQPLKSEFCNLLIRVLISTVKNILKRCPLVFYLEVYLLVSVAEELLLILDETHDLSYPS